jgi:predicted transcriptional regulator
MATAKEAAREILDRLPDDCSLEDIHYHLFVRQMIEKGRQEIREGRHFTQEEVERDLERWLDR